MIEDAADRIWTWLIAPGAGLAWPRIEGVQVFTAGLGLSIEIPPTGGQRGVLFWRLLPDRPLTDPDRLEGALQEASARLYGPRTVRAVRCGGCGRDTAVPVLVAAAPAASGPDHSTYACPDCAPALPPGVGPAEVTAP
ncbi:hypothetical protein V1J52_04020 [Streptomyces sp. TRM 70351]|uniref:hypothetical protein n=1 Tax=Streptomyces sp. TRM 70351 TaxID=3116552 RepID=UPI002E7BC85C|nr:hypothetical protein [Streptomyces sp. TRM 70351]MEE1927356.1 hypothetical protein [Streptomyces sp. TRM 70351]